MRESITTSLRHVAKDRAMLAAFGTMIITSIIAMIYFGIRVRPSDIQVTTHYTSYGGVNFYTSQWWYAIAFALFFLLIAIAHTSIGLKLYALKGREVAIGFAWFSIGMIVFAAITLTYIINIAFPF